MTTSKFETVTKIWPSKPLPEKLRNLPTDEDGTVHVYAIDVVGRPPRCKKPECNGGVFTKHDTIPRENGLVSQRWKCKTCKKVFVYRGGMERMRCESGAVSDMLDQSSKGVSHVNIADSLNRKGLVRNPASVDKTLKKYTTAIQNYTLRIPINHVGDRTRSDEFRKRQSKFLTTENWQYFGS